MRFSTLSVLVAVASAAFSAAAPSPSPAPITLKPRCVCQDIQSIITEVTTVLTPLLEELSSITSDNCTAAVLEPIIEEISVALNEAISQVTAVAGETLTSILTTVDGVVLTVSEVAEQVSELLTLIFTAFDELMRIVLTEHTAEVVELIDKSVVIIAHLVLVIADVVEHVLHSLSGIVEETVLSVVATLGLIAQFSLLDVVWDTVCTVTSAA